MASLTSPNFFVRLLQRIRTALKAEPCPYWADYLHEDPKKR